MLIQRAMIVGGDSMLGKALLAGLNQENSEHPPVVTTRRTPIQKDWFHLDLAGDNLKLPSWASVVYLIAAVTKVVDCDANPQATWRVNADAPVALGMQALKAHTHVVFLSSDAVERAPNLIYSKQKAYAETIILANGGTVVRPSRIPPDKTKGLVELLIKLGISQPPGLFRWSP